MVAWLQRNPAWADALVGVAAAIVLVAMTALGFRDEGLDPIAYPCCAVAGLAFAVRRRLPVVTYDEFGGQWDHVSPPGLGGTGPSDQWGPSTRIPALVLAPRLRDDFVVDRVSHDTTSILATIEHRFGLDPLTSRDGAVSDLSSVFSARGPHRHRYWDR